MIKIICRYLCVIFTLFFFNNAYAADTLPPTVPPDFLASAASTSQINVTWSPATDDTAVTSYDIYRNGAFLIRLGGTRFSHSDRSLNANTTYTYALKALDAAGNQSAFTPSSAATTKPAPPSSVTATPISMTQINVAWPSASGPAGIAGYKITRNNTPLPIPLITTTSYSDSGLSAGTTYTYRIITVDTAGVESSSSVSAAAKTLDTIAPSVPASLTATALSTSQIRLTWPAATDNVGVTQYWLYMDGSSTPQILTTTTFTHAGLSPNSRHTYMVAAVDAAGNRSATTTLVTANTKPSAPTNIQGVMVSMSRLDLTWAQIEGTTGIAHYKITRGTNPPVISATKSYSDTTVVGGATYSYKISAVDTAGTESAQSAAFTVTMIDTAPPSVPSDLAAVAVSPTKVDVSWRASTDNVKVTGYKIFRDGVQIGTSATAKFSDSGLVSTTSYSYQVKAYDASTNESALSAPINVIPSEAYASTPIVYGQTLSVVLGTQLVKKYTFDASAGDKILIAFNAKNAFTARVDVEDAVHNQLATQDAAALSDIIVTVPSTGTYVVWVRAASGGTSTSRVDLTLNRLNSPAGATAAVLGTALSGNMTVTAHKIYTVTLTAGDKLIVSYWGTVGARLRIYDVNGVLGAEGSAATNALSELSFTPAATGAYSIVTSLPLGTIANGRIDLTLYRLNNPLNVQPMTYGETKSITLGITGINVYAFTAVAGENVSIPFSGVTQAARIRLYDSAANIVGEASGITGQAGFVVPSNGTYYIFAGLSAATASANYSFTLQRLSDIFDGAVPVVFGGTITQPLDTAAHIDPYVLTVRAGDLIQVPFKSPAYPVSVILYDETGNVIDAVRSAKTGTINAKAIYTGKYYININYQGYPGGTGNYTFTIDDLLINGVDFPDQFFDPSSGESAVMKFHLERDAQVKFHVYKAFLDNNGALQTTLVQTIATLNFSAGPNTFVWDGKGTSGALLPNDTYVIAPEATEIGGTRHSIFSSNCYGDPVPLINPVVNNPNFDPYKNETVSLAYGLASGAWVSIYVSTPINYMGHNVFIKTLFENEPRDIAGNVDTWDGKRQDGVIYNEGNYQFYVFAADLPPHAIVIRSASANITTLSAVPYAFYPKYGGLTEIQYAISKDAVVTLDIRHPATGAVVRTLVNARSDTAGSYSEIWDGTDDAGNTIASGGQYTIQLTAVTSTGVTTTRKAHVYAFR